MQNHFFAKTLINQGVSNQTKKQNKAKKRRDTALQKSFHRNKTVSEKAQKAFRSLAWCKKEWQEEREGCGVGPHPEWTASQGPTSHPHPTYKQLGPTHTHTHAYMWPVHCTHALSTSYKTWTRKQLSTFWEVFLLRVADRTIWFFLPKRTKQKRKHLRIPLSRHTNRCSLHVS